MEKTYESSLILEHIVFDKIEFKRINFQQKSDIKYRIQIEIGKFSSEDGYKVSLTLEGNKEGEYIFTIGLSGFFSLELTEEEQQQVDEEKLLKTNAVAILMPYLRSEATLLTSQPETDPVVLPVFNVNAIINDVDV